MVLTSHTRTILFASAATATASTATKTLVRLPLSVVPHYEQRCAVTGAIVPATNKPLFRVNLWSSDEHERFLHGLEMFPNGPWKEIAKVVGTKTTRQTMTHAQKYRQKIERRLQAKPKPVSKKARRRHQLQAMNVYYACAKVIQNATHIHTANDTLTNASHACAVGVAMQALPPVVCESPGDVYSDAFDVNFLDQEFDAILRSLQTTPQLETPRSLQSPDSYVFSL